MASHELPLQMGGEIGNYEIVASGYGGNFFAIGFAPGSALQIKEPSVPGGNLHGQVTQTRRPSANRVKGIERLTIGRELREKDSRTLYRFHVRAPNPFWTSQLLRKAVKEFYQLPGMDSIVMNAPAGFYWGALNCLPPIRLQPLLCFSVTVTEVLVELLDAFAPMECHFLPPFDQTTFAGFTKERSCEKL
jgi:hypothetical protein